jgi:transcriptional regulator with XRE-family HTH domain
MAQAEALRGRSRIAAVDGVTLTPAQCREARLLLGLTRERLAELSGVGHWYVSSFERIGRLPHSRTGRNYGAEIRTALEAAGIQFVDERDAGVRLRKGKA